MTVETGVCKAECDAINQVFFHYIRTKRPYVVMKYAMTLDGKIATRDPEASRSGCSPGTAARRRVRPGPAPLQRHHGGRGDRPGGRPFC